MSTDNMPNPSGTSEGPVPAGNPETQDTAASASAATPGSTPATASPAPPPAPFNLAQDIASIIEGQADILAQRLVYTSQTTYGVGAVGVDVVNARNAALVLANALRNHADIQAEQSLVGVGDPQVVQVNDGTLPFKNNGQVAGLFEGLVLDTVSRAYSDNPSRLGDARVMLNDIFQPANEQMQNIHRQMTNLKSLAPGLPPSR